jgi:hypothetical protein
MPPPNFTTYEAQTACRYNKIEWHLKSPAKISAAVLLIRARVEPTASHETIQTKLFQKERMTETDKSHKEETS